MGKASKQRVCVCSLHAYVYMHMVHNLGGIDNQDMYIYYKHVLYCCMNLVQIAFLFHILLLTSVENRRLCI